MSVTEQILRLDGAALPTEPAGGATAPIDLAVVEGDLVLLEMGDPRRAAAFADALMGLVPPLRGRVSFDGCDWQETPQVAADALRGRIGRAFRDDPWLPFLSVAENIILRPAHHTRTPPSGLLTEAVRLCRLLGLPGVPAGYPGEMTEDDLRRAGLARAFVGSPRLVVLEHPTERLGITILGPILRLARILRDEGSAILWFVFGERREGVAAIPATRRLRLIGNRLVSMDRVAA